MVVKNDPSMASVSLFSMFEQAELTTCDRNAGSSNTIKGEFVCIDAMTSGFGKKLMKQRCGMTGTNGAAR